jgi:ABC-2 type transport system ATP-binding protein
LVVELKQERRGMVLCTHDLGEAERLANQVAIIRAGRLVALDTPVALRAGAAATVGVRVELDSDSPTALDMLAGMSGINDLGGYPAESGSGMTIGYTTREPRQVNPVVIARLVDGGARIVTVTTAVRSLEQVYAAAVGGASVGEDRPTTVGSDGR